MDKQANNFYYFISDSGEKIETPFSHATHFKCGRCGEHYEIDLIRYPDNEDPCCGPCMAILFTHSLFAEKIK